MAVGTKQVNLKLIKNNELKLTNLKAQQVNEKQTKTFLKFFLNLLKQTTITLAIIGATMIGQAWAGAVLSSFAIGETAIAVGSKLVGSSISFGLSMLSDAAQGDVTLLNTILNLTAFLEVFGAFKFGKNINAIIQEADEFRLFKQFKIDLSKIKNLNDIAKELTGKIRIVDGMVYDFTKKMLKPKDVLELFAQWSVNIGSLIAVEHSTISALKNIDVNQLVKFQNLLKKINPKIFLEIGAPFLDEAQTFLKKMKLKPKDLTDELVFDKIINIAKNEAGLAKEAIWGLYSLQITQKFNEELIQVSLNILKKANNVLGYLDINKIIKKFSEKLTNKLLKPVKSSIKQFKMNVLKKIDPVIEQVNNAIFEKLGKKANTNFSKYLIPINGSDFLAYQTESLFNNKYLMRIYFKKIELEPQFFLLDKEEMIEWSDACTKNNKADEYYQKKLKVRAFIGNAFISEISNIFSPIIKDFIAEGRAFYLHIKKLKEKIVNNKSTQNKIINIAEKIQINYLENIAIKSAIKSGIIEIIS